MTEDAGGDTSQGLTLPGVADATPVSSFDQAGGSRRWHELVRFLPDVGRLLVDLTRDGRVPLRAKVVAGLLGAYLFSPLDLVPDFLPGVGQMDDLALALVALRYLCRSAGYDVLRELWRGSHDGFVALLVVTGVEK
ncbi:MAG: YkvA family protein [Nitriliruptorales bacterium]